MVTVLNAWSADTSWKICAGVNGVRFFCGGFKQISDALLITGRGMTYLVVANQPDSWCLVVLVVRDHNIIRAYLQEVPLRYLHLAVTAHESAAPVSDTRQAD